MHEPSLSCGPTTAQETYRFLWLRSFHHPVAIRITRNENQYELTTVVLNGAGGYEPGEISRNSRRPLSKAEWDKAMTALSKFGFWRSKTVLDTDIVGTDGAQWIVEGQSGRYHVVESWGGLGGLQDIGLTMLELSGLNIPKDEIY
jgi:hypothetical protein